MAKIKIGVVDYLNALPLTYGLERERGVQIVRAAPSVLAAKMRKGQIDVGLMSSIECFRNPDLQILPEVGVCSEGAVKSIKLYLRDEPQNVQRVALDSSSCTAAVLTKIVFQEFYENLEADYHEIRPDVDPEEVEDAEAVLLIGDRALQARPGSMTTIDLGALWTERTGLPFVYAMWMCRQGTKIDNLLPLLLRARDRGLPERPRMAQKAAKELKLPAAGLSQYLSKNLRYQLGEREIKGLERFRDLAAQFELCDRRDVPFLRVRMQTV